MREKKKKITFNREIFDTAMKRKKYSLSKLSIQCSENVSEGMLRRARSEGKIEIDILDEIAKRLNVDPYWLSGQYLEMFPFLKLDKEFLRLENHPYVENNVKKTEIDSRIYFLELLSAHGITEEQFQMLSEEERIRFYEDLGQSMEKIILKYLSEMTNTKED